MSARSKLVQINRSLIILDPQTMPINLGHAGREDYPEQSFPCLAYDGHNVLPTALGYQSYFAEHNRLNIGDALKDLKVQHVFHYQSVNMRTLSVALCEQGIYIANGSEGANGFEWQQVIDLSAGFVEGMRRLWSYCVISNKLYMYLQGTDAIYALVNPAEYEETTIPSTIVGASIEKVWFNASAQTGIHKVKPNFINMAGQIGIFKAGNRLGIWDSDGAVAWSSGTQVYDFKPSTTTFAGITTFTDVVGRITTIKQHSSGFIIYATRSITLVSPLAGSPEKWSGRAIFSDVGVVFDTQVALAQPDAIHYAITSGGLCRITNGNPEYIEPEVMDYIRNNNKIYSISFVDARYIFIHGADEFDSAIPVLNPELVDSGGNKFLFPRPDSGEYADLAEAILAMLNSTNPNQQVEFPEVQDPEPDIIIPQDREALLPCWDIKVLDTNFSESAVPTGDSWRTVELFEVPSLISSYGYKRRIHASDTSGWSILDKRELDAYYYDLDRDGIDLGPEEFAVRFNEEVGKIADILNIGQRAADAFGELSFGGADRQDLIVPTNTPLQTSTKTEKYLVRTYYINNVISSFEGKVTDCGIQLLAQLADIEAKAYLNSRTEQVINAFTGLTAAIVYGVAAEPGTTNPVYGEYRIALAYASGGNLYPVDSESAVILSAARSKETVQALNWESRIGQSIFRFSPVTPWLLACQLNDSTPTKAIPVSVVSGSFGNAAWVEITNTSGPGVAGARIAGTLGLQPPIFTRSISFSDSPDPDDDCTSGPIQSGYPADVATAFARPNNAAQTLERSESTVIRTGKLFGESCQLGKVISNQGQYVISGIHAYVEGTTTFLNKTPTQVVNAILAAMGALDITPSMLEELRNKILAAATNIPKIAVLQSYDMIVERDLNIERFPELTTIFEAEVSGYGYYPYGGFSFRKTHSRSIFKPCGYNISPTIYTDAPPVDAGKVVKTIPNTDVGDLKPPYSWDYPSPITLPPNYVLFQEGTLAPYYPTYRDAVVLDTLLNKWGRYNNEHKLVYSLFPINRTDQTIVPNQAGILRGGALSVDGWSSVFSPENNNSRITYGKIGDYRLGWTTATKAVIQFGYASSCYVIAETSMDGDIIDQDLSQAITVENTRRADMPFTLAGKWFNIRLEGKFNLVGLSFESEARGRR